MESINLPSAAKKRNELCLCKAIRPTIVFCRLFGLFPIVTAHEKGYCTFKRSNIWMAYSIFRLVTLLLQICFTTEIFDLSSLGARKSLHGTLNSIMDIFYAFYFALLLILNNVKARRITYMFNQIVHLMKEGLLCQSALKMIRKVQYGALIFVYAIIFTQAVMLAYLSFSDSYITAFDISMILNRISQNVTFFFYMQFLCLTDVIVSMLACFEKLTIKCLNYEGLHPLKSIEQTNNTSQCFGIKYILCKEEHLVKTHLHSLRLAEQIEHLRALHEEISIVMYEINQCFNPQLLCHTAAELTVLIIHWYAVIIYIAFNFSTPMASSLHFLNCLFVIFHSLGLFLFLKAATHQQNMVYGLTNILLEFSTRISHAEDHQQVRLFIEKLKLHRPLTASGIFTIDLTIAGPICANILTYVLVALQFDVSKG